MWLCFNLLLVLLTVGECGSAPPSMDGRPGEKAELEMDSLHSLPSGTLEASTLWMNRRRAFNEVDRRLRIALDQTSRDHAAVTSAGHRNVGVLENYSFETVGHDEFIAPRFHATPSLPSTYLRVTVYPRSGRSARAGAPYKNLFNVHRGVMVLMHNYKPNDLTPAPSPHSDILFWSYMRAIAATEEPRQPINQPWVPPALSLHPLHLVLRCNILNSETEGILIEAYRRAGVSQSRVRRTSPSHGRPLEYVTYPEREWMPATEQFKAIMGTVHGVSILWLLTDHASFWGFREVTSVVTKREAPAADGAGGGWSMLMRIGKVATGEAARVVAVTMA